MPWVEDRLWRKWRKTTCSRDYGRRKYGLRGRANSHFEVIFTGLLRLASSPPIHRRKTAGVLSLQRFSRGNTVASRENEIHCQGGEQSLAGKNFQGTFGQRVSQPGPSILAETFTLQRVKRPKSWCSCKIEDHPILFLQKVTSYSIGVQIT